MPASPAPRTERLLARYSATRDAADMEELVRRFDPARGCALSTFAVPTILGEVGRELALAPAQAARLLRSSMAHLAALAA